LTYRVVAAYGLRGVIGVVDATPATRLSKTVAANVISVTYACRMSLNFPYFTFTGRLPESLGKLHMLSSLNVFHNDLNGNIPASLGNLASLTSLSLGSNRLRGAWRLSDSVVLKHCIAVAVLLVAAVERQRTTAVHNNSLLRCLPSLNCVSALYVGPIPESLCALSMLSTLNLTKNQLSGTIPLGVCHMVCLMSLNLSYNRLKGNTRTLWYY
jgi:Leucine-rich repeat (LRR) protein